LEDTLV